MNSSRMRLLSLINFSFFGQWRSIFIQARPVTIGFACVAAFILSGCESGDLGLYEGGSTRVAYEKGIAIAQSQKKNAVIVRLLTSGITEKAGDLPTVFVAIYNGSDSESFDFSTRNITASFGNATVSVYTAKQMAVKLKNESTQESLNEMMFDSINIEAESRSRAIRVQGDKGGSLGNSVEAETFQAKNEAAAVATDSIDPMVLVAQRTKNNLGNEFENSLHDLLPTLGASSPDRILQRISQSASSGKINGNDLNYYLFPCAVAPRTFTGGVIKLNTEDVDVRKSVPLKLVITVGSESHEFLFRYREEKLPLNLPENISEGDALADVWKNRTRELGEHESRPIALKVGTEDGKKVIRGFWYMSEDNNPAMKPSKSVFPAAGPIVKMEPFFVTETTDHFSWRYATVPGYEILSHHSDSDSKAFLQQVDCAQQVLHAIIQAEFLADFGVPHIIIISTPEMMSPLSQEIMISTNAKSRNTPNVILFSNDRTASLIILDYKSYDMTLADPEYLRLLLEKRVPKLPAWFITGMMTLYTDMFRSQVEAVRDEEEPFNYLVPRFTWISPKETRKVSVNNHAFSGYGQDSEIMNALFLHEPLPESEEWTLWNARAGLFVRWAFDGNQASRMDAFWKFVSRAASEPPTESMFEECFGRNYHDIVEQLNNYLPLAITDSVGLRVENIAPKWKPEFRYATGIETARIQGDWERLALCNVKREYVDSTSNYIKTSLTQKYNTGARDPRLLAVLGLLDCYAHSDMSAKNFLDEAVNGKVVGPEVYFQLARIRYNQMKYPDRLLSASETKYVMEPLESAYTQRPPQHEYYDLALNVLANSSSSLTNRQQILLEAGLQYFPRDLVLLYEIAALDAAHGTKDKALALAVRGLRLSTTDEDRARFSTLKGKLTVGLK